VSSAGGSARRCPLTVLLAVGTLLVPGMARAADDPGLPDWPAVQPPNGSGGATDPKTQDWPAVEPPDNGGTASDPKEPDWPAPEPR
jgi:hypothetical protein